MHGYRRAFLFYWISWSRSRNKSESKNCSMVIPKPSQSFLMVEMVALRLRPLTMLLTVDWVTPLMVLSLLMEIFFSRHSSRIRSLTASPIHKGDHLITSFQLGQTPQPAAPRSTWPRIPKAFSANPLKQRDRFPRQTAGKE